jgi:hypothetical protein
MRWQENVEQTLTEKKIASIASQSQLVQHEKKKLIANSVPKRLWMPNIKINSTKHISIN